MTSYVGTRNRYEARISLPSETNGCRLKNAHAHDSLANFMTDLSSVNYEFVVPLPKRDAVFLAVDFWGHLG
jgi:hypothetical protein